MDKLLSELLEEKDPNNLNPGDFEEIEPDRTIIALGYDADIYESGNIRLMVRDNPESVWVKQRDGDFKDDGVLIREKRAEIGQNTMGGVTTALRKYSPVTEPDGPNTYKRSYNHQDIFNNP